MFSWFMLGLLAFNVSFAFFNERPSKWIGILGWSTALLIQLTLMRTIGVL